MFKGHGVIGAFFVIAHIVSTTVGGAVVAFRTRPSSPEPKGPPHWSTN